jgi:hypothetical protein
LQTCSCPSVLNGWDNARRLTEISVPSYGLSERKNTRHQIESLTLSSFSLSHSGTPSAISGCLSVFLVMDQATDETACPSRLLREHLPKQHTRRQLRRSAGVWPIRIQDTDTSITFSSPSDPHFREPAGGFLRSSSTGSIIIRPSRLGAGLTASIIVQPSRLGVGLTVSIIVQPSRLGAGLRRHRGSELRCSPRPLINIAQPNLTPADLAPVTLTRCPGYFRAPRSRPSRSAGHHHRLLPSVPLSYSVVTLSTVSVPTS